MVLEELTLSHFRSHRLARLTLDARPVAIWGPNGAGKTNILEAVSLFSPGRGLRRASAAEMAREKEMLPCERWLRAAAENTSEAWTQMPSDAARAAARIAAGRKMTPGVWKHKEGSPR